MPRIRELNDQLRTTGLGRNGRVIIAGGLAHAGPEIQEAAVIGLRTFSDFPAGNDPYGEHDFGAFTIDGQRFMFKIDYFSLDELHGSEHPEDPTQTVRVLSLFFAEDY